MMCQRRRYPSEISMVGSKRSYLVYAWNSNTKEGVAPPTRCFSSATPAIRSGRGAKTDQRMDRIALKATDGWLA